ncbi:hypothetical protein BN1708_020330, partial [Verticillium longisporum]
GGAEAHRAHSQAASAGLEGQRRGGLLEAARPSQGYPYHPPSPTDRRFPQAARRIRQVTAAQGSCRLR